MALTQDKLDDLIEKEEANDSTGVPLVLRIFGKALGHVLEDQEGIVVHIPCSDSDGLISCIVYKDNASGTVKIIPDPSAADMEDGMMVWMHHSKEEAEAATAKQQRSELH